MGAASTLLSSVCQLDGPCADTYWSPTERQALVNGLLARMVVGSPATVTEQLGALIAETKADAFIIDTDIYDHQQRLTSVEIIADALSIINR